MLPGQGYCTTQEAMIYWYGAVIKMSISKESLRNSKKDLLQHHFVLQESLMKSPGIEPQSQHLTIWPKGIVFCHFDPFLLLRKEGIVR
jgi:hypothetical protein